MVLYPNKLPESERVCSGICIHTSRHTFASTVTLANNISLEVVSKMLGHTNTRMTNHYAKLIDKCIGEQMDKLMDTFTGDSNY